MKIVDRNDRWPSLTVPLRTDMTRRQFFIGATACGLIASNRALALDHSDPTSGFVLGPGPAGRCDDYKIGVPVPLLDRDGRSLRMWYYCRSNDFSKVFAPTLSSGRVALAESDDGRCWRRFKGPLAGESVFEPSVEPQDFDSGHLGITDITFAHGKYWMWYFGGNAVTADTRFGQIPGLAMLPGLAHSPNGVDWTRVRGAARGGALLDPQPGDIFASWINGVWDGDRMLMWYTGLNGQMDRFTTYLAASTDGMTWDPLGTVSIKGPERDFDGMGMMTRHVMANPFGPGPRWFMLYTALDGREDRNLQRSVVAATSDDGLVWTRLYDEPIFVHAAPGHWDGEGVAAPRLVIRGDEMLLYYTGIPEQDAPDTLPKGIGLAVATGRDLRGFRRHVA